ncbi:hypothetical protein GCM10010327_37490 [Streptomyces nitrosporeus]|nr:hypothetical protein GCM10010327_37490 [Streptomyces nitrosporeus]
MSSSGHTAPVTPVTYSKLPPASAQHASAPPRTTSAIAHPSGSGPTDGGRGLMLVEGFADRWGRYPRDRAPGKAVWAECALPGAALSP